MGSHHSHHHTHIDLSSSSSRLFVTMALNFIITIAELIGGILSGSLSLISDALHNFSDGVSIIITYIAIRLSEKSNTEKFTFGLKRAEIMAAMINSAALIAICFYLFKASFERFATPEPVQGGLMISVALIGLAANVFGTALLHRDSKTNINIRSAYLHLLSDAISSVAVIVGGVMIYLYNIYWIDPLLTIVISAYVLKESYDIMKEASNVLMMGAPTSISLETLRDDIESIEAVDNIHHVHIWALSGSQIHFEAHVDVDDMLISQCGAISKRIEEKLKRRGINHVTLQFECGACELKKDCLI